MIRRSVGHRVVRPQRILATVALGLSLAGAAAVLAQSGRLGQRPVLEPTWRPLEIRYSLLDTDPCITIGPGRIASLAFDTRVPTPRAALACGLLLPGRALRAPQYCRVIPEEGDSDSLIRHLIRIDLEKLEARCGDFLPGLREARGGTIEALLEVHDPRLQQGAALPLRFAYRDTSRVPCLSDGPWIDVVDGTRAVLSWGTDLPVRGRVRYSIAADTATAGPVIDFHEGVRHRVELAGLTPGVTYRYTILLDDPRMRPDSLIEGPFSFRVPATDEAFLFAVIGDSRAGPGPGESRAGGVNARVLRTLCRDAVERGAAFALFSGDMADGETTVAADVRRQWETWKRGATFVSDRLPFYESVGNHESCPQVYGDSIPRAAFDREGAESIEAMFSEFFAGPRNGPPRENPDAPEYGETVYSFRWGRSLFLVLNTYYWVSTGPETFGGNLAGYVMDRQLSWAEGLLRAAADDSTVGHVFVLLHHPPFPCGGHLHDSMWYHGGSAEKNRGPHGEPIDRSYVLARRDRLWGAFARCGKLRAVFAGHEHNYSRLLVRATTPVHPDGGAEPSFTHPVWQCVSGGCGAPSYARDEEVPWAGEIAAFSMVSHYLLIGVSGDDVALFALGETGEQIDGGLLAENGRVSETAITLSEWRARGRSRPRPPARRRRRSRCCRAAPRSRASRRIGCARSGSAGSRNSGDRGSPRSAPAPASPPARTRSRTAPRPSRGTACGGDRWRGPGRSCVPNSPLRWAMVRRRSGGRRFHSG